MRSDSALDRLNASERELLLLLGQGHTAKSIAAFKELSEFAVNERFRSARRKTGIGSSREIARLLAAQENRHDFMGLAPDPATASDLPRPDAPALRRASILRRWSLPMIAAGLLAVALFAQQTVAPPTGEGQPLVSEILSHQQQAPDMAALHAEASGAPDPEWSPGAEAMLSERYGAILGDADALESLGVTCSATLCEVAGTARLDVTGERVADLLKRLQDVATGEPVPGFAHRFGHYGSSPARPGVFVFVGYWSRT